MAWLTDTPIAHRGLLDEDNPENSLGAARRAIARGYPIELDLHLAADGVVMVFHDDNLKRITGDPRDIEACTSQQLKTLRLCGTGFGIPTFDEFLDEVEGRVPLLIEIKRQSRHEKNIRILEKITARLDHYNGQYAVQSFHPPTVRWLYKNRPDIIRGQLCSGGDFDHGKLTTRMVQKFFIKNLLVVHYGHPHFIAYEQEHIPNRWTSKYRGRLPLIGWTFRDQARATQLKDEVDNIIFQDFIPE
ncbi:MAG: glycerophosphodiester phosphodiesterase family protein [Christensenellales bacterium]|jgi:glycerophosphoryl diester phosphodiesterase